MLFKIKFSVKIFHYLKEIHLRYTFKILKILDVLLHILYGNLPFFRLNVLKYSSMA